jgi:hypothetical protein
MVACHTEMRNGRVEGVGVGVGGWRTLSAAPGTSSRLPGLGDFTGNKICSFLFHKIHVVKVHEAKVGKVVRLYVRHGEVGQGRQV